MFKDVTFRQAVTRFTSGLFLAGFFVVSPTVQATTITKTTTFNPGIFWADFTYTWSITAMPADIPYNDVHVALGNRTQINLGSYAGPGAASIVAGAGNKGTLQIATIAPGGFAPTIGFSIDTVSNPTFVEGIQKAYLTLGGVQISANFFASATTPIETGFDPGDTLLAFAVGTFDPLANVDLFQNGHTSAQIGFGGAAADGSALISLNNPLNATTLFIGQEGSLVFDTSVPEPSTIVLTLLGMLGMASTKRVRQSRNKRG